MNVVLDVACMVLVRLLCLLSGILPVGVQVRMVNLFLRSLVPIFPAYKKIALTNLALAFPESTPEWRETIFSQMLVNHAQLLVDFFRLPYLTNEWLTERFTFPNLALLKEAQARSSTGVIIATGHLASFELTYHAFCAIAGAVDAVARSFNLPGLNRWWNGIREGRGGKIIARDGAFQAIVTCLRKNRTIAILFDQNVRKHHAVFVDFFGVPAATSKTLALAAIRTRAPIFISAGVPTGDDRHELLLEPCPTEDILNDTTLSLDEKVFRITQRATSIFEALVRQYPAQWFWLHRRWKTQPDGSAGEFYRFEQPVVTTSS